MKRLNTPSASPTVTWLAVNPVIMPSPVEVGKLTGAPKVSALSHTARIALQHSARLSGVTLDVLKKSKNGAPLPHAGVYWSLSHTTKYVAAVTAPFPIGIDIEEVFERSPLLFNKVADQAEWNLAPEVSNRTLYRYWTAKEAVLKAIGKGISGLSDCRIEEIIDNHLLRLCYKSTRWSVSHYTDINDHIISITSDNLPISWHVNEG